MNKMFDAVDALFESNTPLTTDGSLVEEVKIEENIENSKLEENEPYITLKNAKGKEYTIYKKGRDYYSDDNTKLTEEEIIDMREDEAVYAKMEAKAKDVLDMFLASERSVTDFTNALNEISRLEWDNEIDSSLYEKYIKLLQNAYTGKELVTEDMSNAELLDRVKQGVTRGLSKCNSFSDLEGVLKYYLNFVVGQLADGESLPEDIDYTIPDNIE